MDAQPGSVGSINGKITLDLDSVSLPAGGSFPSWATDLSVVVSGTGSSDGTFVQSDFDTWVFDNGGITFDFSQDLIGQGGWGTSCGFSTDGPCDFNLSGPSLLTPFGSYYFQLSTGSNSFILSKFAPASVPCPLPLFGAGAAFGWSRRLRKRLASSATIPPQG